MESGLDDEKVENVQSKENIDWLDVEMQAKQSKVIVMIGKHE